MYLYFKREVFLHVFDDHHKEGQLDTQSLLRLRRTCDVCRAEDTNALITTLARTGL